MQRRTSRYIKFIAFIAGPVLVGASACSSSGGGGGSTASSSPPASSASSSSSTAGASTSASSGGLASFQAKVAALYKGTYTQPPSSAPTPPKAKTVWFISCGQASVGCSAPAAGAVAAGKALGWNVKVFDGNFGVADAYDTGVRQAIAAHADAIIEDGIDCNENKASLAQAKAAGIPVIANGSDCAELGAGPNLFAAQLQYIPQALTENDWFHQIGIGKADWTIVHTNGNAKVIQIDFLLEAYKHELTGFDSELAKCSGCSIVSTVKTTPSDLSNGNLKAAVASALAAHPEANVLYSPGDAYITIAAIPQALASLGRTKSVAVLGQDGLPQNLDLIRQGKQALCTAAPLAWYGWGFIDETIRVLDGKPPVPEGIGFQAIDATHNLPPAGSNYTGPIDFVAAYKKAWGLG